MTLSELVAATSARFGLSAFERTKLAEAVIAYVDDGQLTLVMPDAPGLASKLGEVTLLQVAHRILVERLSGEFEPAELELVAVVAVPMAEREPPGVKEHFKGQRRACSRCHTPGHYVRTCPFT